MRRRRRRSGVACASSSSGDGPFLVVGLGNPGAEYEGTRHNIGFEVVESLAARQGVRFARGVGSAAAAGSGAGNALVGSGNVRGRRVIFLKPQTFMNRSGSAVRAVMRYHKVDMERLIVVYDDLDTDVGDVRLRMKGGHGGHNGMRNIIDQIGTKEFARLRVGIGRPEKSMVRTRIHKYIRLSNL